MLQQFKPVTAGSGGLQNIVMRTPVATDAIRLHRLVETSPPLDANSIYCNLLQCTHFSSTCVAADHGEELAGFVSAYLLPDQPEVLFIWQVVVAEHARGQGLAINMLLEVLQRPACSGVRLMETTINPDNHASWQLFYKLAAHLKATCTKSVLFERNTHFAGQHADEMLLRISFTN